MNKKFFTLITFALFSTTSALAQTKVQNGIVRKITRNNNPAVPVQGVSVTVAGVTCQPSNANGRIKMSVPINRNKSFQLSDIRPAKYILVSPQKTDILPLSATDVIVVVSTPEENAAFEKSKADILKKKNRDQAMQIKKLRDEREETLLTMAKNDVRYAKVVAERDSLQLLYNKYIANRERIEKDIDSIANQLAMTDYQSLDSIDQRIYELKCYGDWKSISDLINKTMSGDPKLH